MTTTTQNTLSQVVRENRRRLSLTQEELAERLGVTSQAVSKWETGAAMPDITLLPVLANFFSVSTDTLLGVDIHKKEEQVNEILAEYGRLANLGMEKEKFDLICRAYRAYPGENRIVEKYIWGLCYDPYHGGSGLLAHEEELLSVCGRILNECVDDEVRYSAVSVLCGLYRDKGDLARAEEMLSRLPAEMQGEERECLFARGDTRWWDAIRRNVVSIVETLTVKLRNEALLSTVSPKEQITLLEKAVSLLMLIYDDGDYGFSHYHLTELYHWIANRYRMMGDDAAAAKYLRLGFAHAKQYDSLPPVVIHTSHAVRGVVFRPSDVASGFTCNLVKRELDYLSACECYDGVREAPWYREIVEEFAPFGKDGK